MADTAKRISAKVRCAIDTIVAGKFGTITDAADHAGLSREHLSRELAKPHVAEHMRTQVLRKLAVGSAKAGNTKLALLDLPNEMVRDRASSFILGLAGISPETAPIAPHRGQVPGFQIVLVQPNGAPIKTIGPGPERMPIDVGQPAHIEHQAAASGYLSGD